MGEKLGKAFYMRYSYWVGSKKEKKGRSEEKDFNASGKYSKAMETQCQSCKGREGRIGGTSFV